MPMIGCNKTGAQTFFTFCMAFIFTVLYCLLIRTIAERHIGKDKDVYAVFVDLEKAFDRVDWKKLTGILKKIGVDWKERRLLSNLYMKQRIKVRIGEEMSEGREIGRGYGKDVFYRLQSTPIWKT